MNKSSTYKEGGYLSSFFVFYISISVNVMPFNVISFHVMSSNVASFHAIPFKVILYLQHHIV